MLSVGGNEGTLGQCTTLMLCAAAVNEKLAPAACGSHHIFLINPCWLVIMRLPIKSITAGLTCVAA